MVQIVVIIHSVLIIEVVGKRLGVLEGQCLPLTLVVLNDPLGQLLIWMGS